MKHINYINVINKIHHTAFLVFFPLSSVLPPRSRSLAHRLLLLRGHFSFVLARRGRPSLRPFPSALCPRVYLLTPVSCHIYDSSFLIHPPRHCDDLDRVVGRWSRAEDNQSESSWRGTPTRWLVTWRLEQLRFWNYSYLKLQSTLVTKNLHTGG